MSPLNATLSQVCEQREPHIYTHIYTLRFHISPPAVFNYISFNQCGVQWTHCIILLPSQNTYVSLVGTQVTCTPSRHYLKDPDTI